MEDDPVFVLNGRSGNVSGLRSGGPIVKIPDIPPRHLGLTPECICQYQGLNRFDLPKIFLTPRCQG